MTVGFSVHFRNLLGPNGPKKTSIVLWLDIDKVVVHSDSEKKSESHPESGKTETDREALYETKVSYRTSIKTKASADNRLGG